MLLLAERKLVSNIMQEAYNEHLPSLIFWPMEALQRNLVRALSDTSKMAQTIIINT